MQLYHLLSHKLVSFSLKYPAILDKRSLLKNNSSSSKASLLNSGREGNFHGFSKVKWKKKIKQKSRQKPELPQRAGKHLAGASRASPTGARGAPCLCALLAAPGVGKELWRGPGGCWGASVGAAPVHQGQPQAAAKLGENFDEVPQ